MKIVCAFHKRCRTVVRLFYRVFVETSERDCKLLEPRLRVCVGMYFRSGIHLRVSGAKAYDGICTPAKQTNTDIPANLKIGDCMSFAALGEMVCISSKGRSDDRNIGYAGFKDRLLHLRSDDGLIGQDAAGGLRTAISPRNCEDPIRAFWLE